MKRADVLSTLVEAMIPLAEAVLALRLPAAVLVHAAKLSCIQVAVRSTAKVKPNVSRTAAITGLTRKEIARLLNYMTGHRAHESPVQAVLRGWMTDPSLRLANGRSCDLPVQGRARSVHWLVRRYGRDVTPAAVLAELVKTKQITRLESGKFRLSKSKAQ